MRRSHWPLKLFGIALILLIWIAGFGQAVLQLWNWLMPSLFGFKSITFWQAVGLFSLSWILFGGPRGLMHVGRGWGRGQGRWAGALSPEERERLRRRGCGPYRAEEPKA